MSKKIIKKCLQCGEKFSSYKCFKQKFCSSNCYHLYDKGKPLKGYKLIKSRESIKKAILARKNDPIVRKRWLDKMKDRVGVKNPRWIKDRSQLVNQDERNSYNYLMWRKSVFTRDNYKCRINNLDCCGKPEVHHILSWRKHPELRYNINNGITLCHAHHPRVKSEEKRLIPTFQELVSVSNLK